MSRIYALAVLLLLFSFATQAQTTVNSTATTPTATSDPQALALAAQSLKALTGGTAVQDVTLTGTATETAGSASDSGTATFKAKGHWESRMDFGGSSHSEIRTLDASGHPIGAWTTPDGASHAMPFHNVWTDGAWALPVFSSLATATQPNMVAKYIGPETRNGSAVQHLQFFRIADASLAAAANDLPGLSQVDIFLDSNSLLPVALSFDAHPDNDASRNIGMVIEYSNYQSVSGVQVPFHVQKMFSDEVFVDFQVSQAVLNSGLNDSTFSIH